MSENITGEKNVGHKKHVKHISVAIVAILFLITGWGLASGTNPSGAPSILLANIKNIAGPLLKNIADAGRHTFTGQKKRTLVKEIYFEENTRENNPTDARQERPVTCAFETFQKPSGNKIILNEIAWMGSAENTNDEWIEIKNMSGADINISGWQVIDKDEQIKIIIGPGKLLRQNELFLLARKQKNSKNRGVDILYDGSLKNSDEGLRVFNENCELQDEAIFIKWPAGDNKTKQTMERNSVGFGWHTSAQAGGTPGKENSKGITKSVAPEEKSSAQNNNEQNDNANTAQTQSNENTMQANESGNIQARIQDTRQEATQQKSQEQTAENEQKNQQEEQVAKPKQDLKILISEIFAGSDRSAKDEFLELYNPNDEEVNLSSWSIRKKSSTEKESSLVSATRLEGKKIPPRKFFLIANGAGYIGHPSPDVVWPSSYTIAYAKNSIVVYNDKKEKVDEIYWEEIPKNKSIGRASWNSQQFSIQDSPTPQNSHSQ